MFIGLFTHILALARMEIDAEVAEEKLFDKKVKNKQMSLKGTYMSEVPACSEWYRIVLFSECQISLFETAADRLMHFAKDIFKE